MHDEDPAAATSRLLSDDVAAMSLEVSGPDSTDVVEGKPVVADRALATLGGVEIGLWEITPGTVRDTEIDEVFIVLTFQRFACAAVRSAPH